MKNSYKLVTLDTSNTQLQGKQHRGTQYCQLRTCISELTFPTRVAITAVDALHSPVLTAELPIKSDYYSSHCVFKLKELSV